MNDKNIYSPPDADPGSPVKTGEAVSDINLASRRARLWASVIDVTLIVMFFAVVFYGTTYWNMAINQDLSLNEQLLSLFLGFAVYPGFNGYLLHKRGQTVGKWVLGIKIVSIESSGVLRLWKVFFARYVPQVLVALIPIAGRFLILINDLFIFRKDKRCVYDLIAGTKVIKEYANQ